MEYLQPHKNPMGETADPGKTSVARETIRDEHTSPNCDRSAVLHDYKASTIPDTYGKWSPQKGGRFQGRGTKAEDV